MDLPNETQRRFMAKRSLQMAAENINLFGDEEELDETMIDYSNELADELTNFALHHVGPTWIN
jgi:hypothetical protein